MDDGILLIRNGGTFDSVPYADPHHPPLSVTTLKGRESPIYNLIETAPQYAQVDLFDWKAAEATFVKDSKEFNTADIRAMADIIRHDDHRYFVITHGTDQIAKNARLLKKALEGSGKVVAIAGAMVPLSMHDRHGSDGMETLHYALDHVRDVAPGVHIAGINPATKRHGFLDPGKVEKDWPASRTTLRFTLAER